MELNLTIFEKDIINEANKSKCLVYGGFIRDKILGLKYKDIDMKCENLNFTDGLSSKYTVETINNVKSSSGYSMEYKTVSNSDDEKILINYGLKFEKELKLDYSCNALYLKDGKLFATNNQNLEDILNDIKNKKCVSLHNLIAEGRKPYMESKGFKVL